MYKNKAEDGRNNICGRMITQFRKAISPKTSQKMLADMLQRGGLILIKMQSNELNQDNVLRQVLNLEL